MATYFFTHIPGGVRKIILLWIIKLYNERLLLIKNDETKVDLLSSRGDNNNNYRKRGITLNLDEVFDSLAYSWGLRIDNWQQILFQPPHQVFNLSMKLSHTSNASFITNKNFRWVCNYPGTLYITQCDIPYRMKVYT